MKKTLNGEDICKRLKEQVKRTRKQVAALDLNNVPGGSQMARNALRLLKEATFQLECVIGDVVNDTPSAKLEDTPPAKRMRQPKKPGPQP